MALLHKGWVQAAKSLRVLLEMYSPLEDGEKITYRLALELLRDAIETGRVLADGPEFWAIYFPLRKYCQDHGDRPHPAYLGALVYHTLSKAKALPDWYKTVPKNGGGEDNKAWNETPIIHTERAEKPVHSVLSGMVGEYHPNYKNLPENPSHWKQEHFSSPREYFLALVAATRDGKMKTS